VTPPVLHSALLEKGGISHGFFSRIGGVSRGDFASLNTGPGSNDAPEHVAENRARCAKVIGADPQKLITNYQVHSADVVTVERVSPCAPPRADAHVTNVPGLALGVLTADCMPWLFVDPDAQIIGAAHAGWRGALGGILENTVSAMEALGAKRERICAAVGPCLQQPNFEAGLDLVDAFTDKHAESMRYFAPGVGAEKRRFDLVGYGRWRLGESGVTQIDDIGLCTLANPDRFFSYRASRTEGADDYGRNLSAIVLL